MTKHPLDHDHGGSSERLKKFTEVERSEQPSDASKALQQRAKDEAGSRLGKYTDIERGKES
ncbi:MAG: hypothetical protein KDJ98_06085 [Rhodobacteraceae bacterium]|nr:hypothetical protein [Paracoccaceae bacterium]